MSDSESGKDIKLEDIGFYTLTNARAKQTNAISPMWRCEMIVTHRCNFNCPYCRGLREDCQGDINLNVAFDTLDAWHKDKLQNIRFSGGEPTLYPHLETLVRRCVQRNVKRIAISTNGTASIDQYLDLIYAGVNDFSISLDACCAADGNAMSGIDGRWELVAENIRRISQWVYVTVGVVLTDANVDKVVDIVRFAHELGVADIRLVTAAQSIALPLALANIEPEILNAHPILKYRVENYKNGRDVRGLVESDCRTCHLVKDDSIVAGKYHFPCVIYMREGGEPIGTVGQGMRSQRMTWSRGHDSWNDPICRQNCLDVCIAYNNKADSFTTE